MEKEKMYIKISKYKGDRKKILELVLQYFNMDCVVILNFAGIDFGNYKFNRLFAYLVHHLKTKGYSKKQILQNISLCNIAVFVWDLYVENVNDPMFLERFNEKRNKKND